MINIEKEFKKSLERVSKNRIEDKSFLEYFYGICVNGSDRMASFFENIDMMHQRKMLEKSISGLLRFYSEKEVNQELLDIGMKHSKEKLNIEPELYEEWINYLIKAVAKYDPQFNDKVELSWRVILAPGIAYMKFSCNHKKLN